MNEEDEAFCVVRDFSGTSQNLKISLNVSNKMTGKEFVQEVAKQFNFEPSSFRLVSPTPNKKNDSYQVFFYYFYLLAKKLRWIQYVVWCAGDSS